MGSQVKVKCIVSRMVGRGMGARYVAGREYEMDAVRAGKYSECFSPVGITDRQIIDKEWGEVRAAAVAEREYRMTRGNVAAALEVLEKAGILTANDIAAKRPLISAKA